MKIYTKTGDKGTTALVGGSRVSKTDVRIEAYGTVDELVSYLALLRDFIEDENTKDSLLKIQGELMVASAILASDSEDIIKKLAPLKHESIVFLEGQIDKLTEELPALTSFIVPGGHKAVSICHIARTICRRSERRIYDITNEPKVPQDIITYFNRLSDYLFVLARWLAKYFNSEEINWRPVLD